MRHYRESSHKNEVGTRKGPAMSRAKTPVDLLAKQTELNARLSDKLRARAEEFATIATEAQGSVTSFATETVTKASNAAKKAA
jgi:Phasin protein